MKKQIIDKLGLEKIEIHCGSSFLYNSNFYKTKYYGVLLSDYDFDKDECLKRKGLFKITAFLNDFDKQGVQHKIVSSIMVTKELLEDFEYVDDLIFNLFKNNSR